MYIFKDKNQGMMVNEYCSKIEKLASKCLIQSQFKLKEGVGLRNWKKKVAL